VAASALVEGLSVCADGADAGAAAAGLTGSDIEAPPGSAARAWRDFHFRTAEEAPVDTVVVGEVVCSKRMPFFAEHLPAVIERLQAAGKEVLLASLALVTLERERCWTAELASDGSPAMVEANDASALAHLAGRPYSVGPFVNVYNEATAAWLVGRGARRLCLPPELPAASIGAMAGAAPPAIEVEVFAFGRVPITISARCYHARVQKLSKDNCQFVCGRDPDGWLWTRSTASTSSRSTGCKRCRTPVPTSSRMRRTSPAWASLRCACRRSIAT
jgi:collagenase-like PrtC family protease